MGKLKVGIIGTGSLANFHIEAYRSIPGVEITALCDNNILRARQSAEVFGIEETYDDYKKMLASSNIDAVSVITWNNTHAPITIAALEAGKHVLCEKPPALNCDEAKKVEEAARKSGKLVMFGFVRRFAQNTILLKEFIEKGDLGELYYIKTGFLRRCGNPGGWFAVKDISGGGPLIDLGVHVIDLAIYLMGRPKPVSVFGSTYNRIGNRSNIRGISCYRAADFGSTENEVEDLAHAVVKFDNGASLFVETSWALNTKSDTFYMDIFGDKGGAQLEPNLEIFSERNNYLLDIKPLLNNYSFDFKEAFGNEIRHFVDCLLNNTQCICPAADGVTVMKIIDAIYESSRTGELVKL